MTSEVSWFFAFGETDCDVICTIYNTFVFVMVNDSGMSIFELNSSNKANEY